MGEGKVREPCRFPEKFWHRKTLKGKRGDLSQFSVENFSSHGPEKLRKGTVLCFKNFLEEKEFYG